MSEPTIGLADWDERIAKAKEEATSPLDFYERMMGLALEDYRLITVQRQGFKDAVSHQNNVIDRLIAENGRLREAVKALNDALQMASHHCPIYEEESSKCKICELIQSTSFLLMPKTQTALEEPPP